MLTLNQLYRDQIARIIELQVPQTKKIRMAKFTNQIKRPKDKQVVDLGTILSLDNGLRENQNAKLGNARNSLE